MTAFVVRSYRDEDSPRVCSICFKTALYGYPIESLLNDSRLVADALVSYYIEYEKESLFIAEAGGRVIGYLTGSHDTRRFAYLFSRRIVPRLVARFLACGHWLRTGPRRVISSLAMVGSMLVRYNG